MLRTQSAKEIPWLGLGPRKGLRDSYVKRALVNIFNGRAEARFRVIFWDGSTASFGHDPEFVIRFRTRRALRALFADPSLGFGEGYTDGDIEIEGDLRQALRLGYRIEAFLAGGLRARLQKTLTYLFSRNSRERDCRNIAYHYDIGDDFYRIWLDKDMVYSCAYFENPDDSIDTAQQKKMALCLRKLRLNPADTLLDIGCGWGSLLVKASREHGVRGLGITLSRSQAEHGRRRIEQEGMSDRLEILHLDYRDLPGLDRKFSKIVSIGMFEHVGRTNIPRYFDAVSRVLEPGGLFLLHTIGKIKDRPTDPWVQRYIFPGCHVPALAEVHEAAASTPLRFVDLEDLRTHYGRTLDTWLARFEAQKEAVRRMFDERFVRMWRLYLAGCSTSFWHGDMHLFQFLWSCGVDNDFPPTRTWMYSPV